MIWYTTCPRTSWIVLSNSACGDQGFGLHLVCIVSWLPSLSWCLVTKHSNLSYCPSRCKMYEIWPSSAYIVQLSDFQQGSTCAHAQASDGQLYYFVSFKTAFADCLLTYLQLSVSFDDDYWIRILTFTCSLFGETWLFVTLWYCKFQNCPFSSSDFAASSSATSEFGQAGSQIWFHLSTKCRFSLMYPNSAISCWSSSKMTFYASLFD